MTRCPPVADGGPVVGGSLDSSCLYLCRWASQNAGAADFEENKSWKEAASYGDLHGSGKRQPEGQVGADHLSGGRPKIHMDPADADADQGVRVAVRSQLFQLIRSEHLALIEEIGVIASAARQEVIAEAALEEIAALAAVEAVGAGAARAGCHSPVRRPAGRPASRRGACRYRPSQSA